MRVVGLTVCTFVATFGYTQAPDTLWTKTYGGAAGDYGYSVQQTTDGGYVIAGVTASFGAGDSDIWLIKTDSLGDTLWTKTFGGGSAEGGRSVHQTTDDGYIIAGTTESYGAGYKDVWLVKTDSAGDSLWTRTYGGYLDDAGYSVKQTADGGYIVVGYTRNYGAGGDDVWLIKTDSIGYTSWARTFGGSSEDVGISVQQSTDGGYIIVGTTFSFGSGQGDIYLIKTDTSGTALFAKTFGGLDTEVGSDVEQTIEGGYIIVGTTSSYGYGSNDVWLIKTDASGNESWNQTFGRIDSDCGASVQQSSDSGYVITGATASFGVGYIDVYLIRTNAVGDTQWTKVIGGSNNDAGLSVQQTVDGGYIVAGTTSSFGAGYIDIWLIKLKPDVGIEESGSSIVATREMAATIFRGPLQLPAGKICRVFDITGRVVEPDKIQPGIYFIEVDGVVTQKLVKVR